MGAKFKSPRLTEQTLRVVGALAMCSKDEVSGAEIARETKLPSGTLYPILLRLEKTKWLESRWEEESPTKLGRPRRRLYKVTALGAKNTRAAISKVQSAIGVLAWG